MKNKLIISDNNMYLTVDSLIDVSNIITGSSNITLRKVDGKPYGCDKKYIDKDLIGDKIYQLIDQSKERILTIQIFVLHFLKIYIYFMMYMEQIVRYCLLVVSVRGYIRNKTSSMVNLRM